MIRINPWPYLRLAVSQFAEVRSLVCFHNLLRVHKAIIPVDLLQDKATNLTCWHTSSPSAITRVEYDCPQCTFLFVGLQMVVKADAGATYFGAGVRCGWTFLVLSLHSTHTPQTNRYSCIPTSIAAFQPVNVWYLTLCPWASERDA